MTGSPACLVDVVGLGWERVEALVRDLTARQCTVATAESLTGGLLAAVLTEVPGSSATVRGGLIVYATDLKQALAGVTVDLLTRRGPVDPEVAAQLAEGAQKRCGATFGVGLTGVAGPDPAPDAPVGRYYVAVAGPQRTWVRASRTEPGRPQTRSAVRAAAVRDAIDMLESAVHGRDSDTNE